MFFMAEDTKIRIDKWLWAVRIYKTRNLATEACKKGRILVNGLPAKASREIHVGEVLTIRKLPVIYTYKVKQLTGNRLPAKLVENFYIDLTSPEELDKLKVNEVFFVKRDRGSGRPTKKERRIIDKLRNN